MNEEGLFIDNARFAKVVETLNFVLNGEHFQVTVKPIEHHVRAA